MAAAYPFVHHDAKWETGLEHDLTLLPKGDLPCIPHRYEHAGRSKLIAVVVYVVRLYAGKVGDRKACVKRTCIYYAHREDPPSVHPFEKTNPKVCKTWNLQELLDELVR